MEYEGNLILPNSSLILNFQSNSGCDSTVTINLINLEEDIDFLGSDLTTCSDHIIITSPFINTVWENDSPSNNLLVESSGIYSATYIDSLGL